MDKLTDEQVLDVLADAQYREWPQTVADCYTALHGVQVNAVSPRRKPRRSKSHPGYCAARKRIAEIVSAGGCLAWAQSAKRNGDV